jgi:hypothetical protein
MLPSATADFVEGDGARCADGVNRFDYGRN